MAQTQLYVKKAQLYLIEETSQDTFLAPAGSGAGMFIAEDIIYTVNGPNYVPNDVRGDFLQMDENPGPVSANMTFRCRIRGGGFSTDVLAPDFAEALKACGMREASTGTPVTAITYTPLSVFDGAGGNPGPSYSLALLENGVRYGLKGAFGTFTITGNVGAGEPGFLNFNFSGAYVAVADDGLETATYKTTQAPAFVGAGFAINFGSAKTPKGVNNFTLDIGNVIAIGKDINDSSGYYGARITSRRSVGSFDPEMDLVANIPYATYWQAGTAGTIGTGVIGSAQGNRYQISIARATLGQPAWSNRDGIRAVTLPYAVSSLATDVEGTNADISLAFT